MSPADDVDDERNPFVSLSAHLRQLTADQKNAIVRMMLSHFGAFCIGAAIGVGVFSDEVHDRACSLGVFTGAPSMVESCDYLAGLSTKMQFGLAGIAVVVLLTSELVDRRRVQDADG